MSESLADVIRREMDGKPDLNRQNRYTALEVISDVFWYISVATGFVGFLVVSLFVGLAILHHGEHFWILYGIGGAASALVAVFLITISRAACEMIWLAIDVEKNTRAAATQTGSRRE
jgi:hypothetical protein